MPESISDRFALIIDLLCLRLQGRHPNGRTLPGFLAGPVLLLVHTALRRIARQFAAIIARLEAGTLRPRSPSAEPRKRPETRKPRSAWPHRLPNTPNWLLKLFQPSTHAAGDLYNLFHHPELQALLVAAPQLRRILRPLCTMFDIDQPKPPAAPIDPGAPRKRRRRVACYGFAPQLWRPAPDLSFLAGEIPKIA